MLSTPPAFNLSQNQTLQFKSVQDSCFRRNRNLKDFLPTRYSLVNEPLGLFGPPARLVAAWREERLCPLSFPESTTFFSFRESFFAATVSRFSQGARSVYAPLCFRSQQLFFHFVKLSFHREAKLFSSIARSVYAPLRFRSQQLFFHFVKLSFHREAKSFSSIARSVYAPLCFRSQLLFSFPRKFFSLAFP